MFRLTDSKCLRHLENAKFSWLAGLGIQVSSLVSQNVLALIHVEHVPETTY